MLPLCRDQGVGVIPWSPLGAGKLARPWGTETKRNTTDRHNKGMYERADGNAPAVVAAVEAVAKAHGRSMAEVALAWVLQVPGVTAPIIGISKMKHLDDAIAALDLELTADDVAALEAPYQTFLPRI